MSETLIRPALFDKNGMEILPDDQLKVLEQIAALPANQSGVVSDYTSMIKEHPISIIRAETGAGKTTQIPKNIRLETGLRTAVTQPRVLAAISNGSRVSYELLCQTENSKYTLGGDEVGYRTSVDVSSQRTAKLSFNTGGLEMMRQLYSDIVPDILFLDEAHHFSIDTEVLMWLFKTRKDIKSKLVIMSATIDPSVFQDYFKKGFGDIPVLDIPGRTFPVEKIFYDSRDEVMTKTLGLLAEGKTGLFFVSGKRELYDYIEKFKNAGVEIPIYPLHAELTEAEQMQAIINTDREQRLIISTNVAEESITPEGVQFVIDLGMHKASYPNSFGIEELIKEPISQANSLQRAGRAGRLEPGEYHRFNREAFEDIDSYPVPPMSRDMLDREILLFLNKGMDLYQLNKKATSQGDSLFSHSINTSLLPVSYSRLTLIGAIDESGKITQLGKDLLGFNLNIYHARMLLQSLFEGCSEEMVYIVCILAAKGFLGTTDKWKELFSAESSKQTDVVYYMKMFTDFTSRKLSKQFTNKLAGMGVDYEQIDEFHEQEGPIAERKMFFEIVDLSPIGIKNYKLAEIYNLIFVIQKRLQTQGVSLDTSRIPTMKDIKTGSKLESIQTCIHAGYPFFTAEFDGKEKKFTSRVQEGGIGNLNFQCAKTSLVSPVAGPTYAFYPFIIELEDPEKENLHLASFVTTVSDYSIKKAVDTAMNYASPLIEKKKKNNSPSIKLFSELESRYIEILGDISKISSVEEFMELVLPTLVLVNNHKFRKFIVKNPQKIDELLQRLTRYFKNNPGIYAHRINLKDIKKVDRSFRDDTAIYGNFRAWETKFVTDTKKRTNQEARYSPKQRNELHTQIELQQLKKQFVQVAGEYRSRGIQIDSQTILRKVYNKAYEAYILSSTGLNRVMAYAKEEIAPLSISDIQAICVELSRRSKTKTKISKMRKYSRYLESIHKELISLRGGNRVEDIDREFLLKFAKSRYFSQQARSQRDKYIKSVNDVFHQWIERRDPRKIETSKRHIDQLINTLTTLVENLNSETSALQKDFSSYRIKDSKNDYNNIIAKLRKYLENFLYELFGEEYVVDTMSDEIDKLIQEIYRNPIRDGKKDIEDVVLNFLIERKHMRNAKNKDIRESVGLVTDFEDTSYSIETSFIDAANAQLILDSQDPKELESTIKELAEKIQKLRELQSQIYQ